MLSQEDKDFCDKATNIAEECMLYMVQTYGIESKLLTLSGMLMNAAMKESTLKHYPEHIEDLIKMFDAVQEQVKSHDNK